MQISGIDADAIKLPLLYDPTTLRENLARILGERWIRHFVTDNYEGDWSGVADFEMQYVLQMGDCDNTGTVSNDDTGCVNAAIPCFSGCGDDRREDMDGNGIIISLDVGVVNGHIPSSAVTKPSGH